MNATAAPFDPSYHNPGTIPAETGLCSSANNRKPGCQQPAVWSVVFHDSDHDRLYASCDRHLPPEAVKVARLNR